MIGICCLYSLKKSLTELAVEKKGYPMLYDLIEVRQLYLFVNCFMLWHIHFNQMYSYKNCFIHANLWEQSDAK